jgi:thiosulfate/3-mercaptopyruvate sulfurtransferase
MTPNHGKVPSSSADLIKGLSSGHIPGSISLPFQKLLDPDTSQYRGMDELRAYFETELDPSKDTVVSCGTGICISLRSDVGVTASIIFLALEASNYPSKLSLYDGSWTEYAARHANSADMIIKDV